MTKHLFSHFKNNAIAYFALFVALGGTSYASVSIPQHLNAAHSAKAGITCGGKCPASKVYWAYVAGSGVIPGGAFSGPVYQTAVGGYPATMTQNGVGDYTVYFANQDLSNCARFANLVHARGSATVGGWDNENPSPYSIHVLTTNATGQAANEDFVVAAICGNQKGLQLGAAPPASGGAAAG